MLTPAEAEKLMLAALAPFPREDCALAAAHGRVLRADYVRTATCRHSTG